MSFLLKSFFRLLLLLLIVGVGILAYSRYIEPFYIVKKEIAVSSAYVGEKNDGLEILVFADTHFGDYYTADRFRELVSDINKESPDIVFFLGDLIDHYTQFTQENDVEELSGLLAEIKATYGKYAIFGNHDYGGGAENYYSSIMSAGDFRVLVNESLTLRDLDLLITGIDDVLIGYGDPKAAGGSAEDLFHIVLSHAPDVADEIAGYNVDLVLSAHTHGRQVNLHYFDDKILPPYGRKYIKGLFSLHNERQGSLYVTSGIGMTQLPFRFLSPPELTVITLKSN